MIVNDIECFTVLSKTDTAKRAILMQTGHGNTPGIPQEDPEHVCSTPPRTEPADAPANKKRQRACILQKNFIKSSKCDYGFQSYQIDFFQNISRQTATIGRRKGGKNLQLSGKRPRPEGAAASLSSRPEGGARSGEICYIIMEKISPLRSRRLGKRLRPR